MASVTCDRFGRFFPVQSGWGLDPRTEAQKTRAALHVHRVVVVRRFPGFGSSEVYPWGSTYLLRRYDWALQAYKNSLQSPYLTRYLDR